MVLLPSFFDNGHSQKVRMFLDAKKFVAQVKLRVISREFFFPVALRSNADYGLLILEASRSHTTKHNGR